MLPPPPRQDTLVDSPDQLQETWHAAKASSAGDAATVLPVIPGYQVVGLIGRGAMGRVYKALHLGLQRYDAVKMLTFGADRSLNDRFAIEAQAVARLKHPHIAQVYDTGQIENAPYYAMELIEGGTLADYLAGRPQDPRFAAELLEKVARAVHHCHEAGILHRDLKPGNILLDRDLTPKITDFGLAKQLTAESQQTRTGDVIGTPCYMAPEQASGMVKELGPETDVYALGSILYECLTGHPPFQTPEVFQTLMLVMTKDPVAPSVLLPKLPRDLNTICMKCLEKSSKRRYATALELAEDLRRFLEGEAIHARPVSRAEKAWKWLRRHPAVAGFLLLGFVLVTTIVVSYIQLQSAYRDLSAAKHESDQHLDVARDVLSNMTLRLLVDLPVTPQTERIHTVGLEQARRFFEDLAKVRPRDVESRVRLIRDYLRLAAIESTLGRFQQVESTLDRAQPIADELVRMKVDPTHRVFLLAILNQRVRLAVGRGNSEQLQDYLKQATELEEPLRDLSTPEGLILQERVKLWAELGRAARTAQRFGEAEGHYRKTLQLLTQLAEYSGFYAEDKVRDLAVAHNNLGTVLLLQKKLDAAGAEFEKARQQIESDTTPRQRELLGQIQTNQGVVAEELKKTADAEKAYSAALYVFERLAEDYPAVPDYRLSWARVKLNTVALLALDDRIPAAKTHLVAARPVLEKLCKDYPSNAAYQAELKRLNAFAPLVGEKAGTPRDLPRH